MRLIDADRLNEVLNINFGHTGGADVLRQLIDIQPTVQAVPIEVLQEIRQEIEQELQDYSQYAKDGEDYYLGICTGCDDAMAIIYKHIKKSDDEWDRVTLNALEGDLISRQAVKDKYRESLVNNLKDDDRGIDLSKYAEEPCKAFCEFMDSIPPVNPQEPKWIPVSERLPDNTDDVLVYDYSDIFVAWYSGKHGNWFSADNRFDEYTPIIAWQPLPEPYEPQESEDI